MALSQIHSLPECFLPFISYIWNFLCEKKWAVRWYEDVSLRSLFDFSVQMRKDGLDWPATFQQSLPIHNERLLRSYFQADPLQCFLYQWIYICNSVFFKIFYCNLIIKNYLLGISLTQSWKKSFFCSDTWQMFLVLNGMGNKDKLGPLALQPPISLFSYTRFSSLSSDLLINGFSLGLREPTCNMQMRD